MGWKNRIKQWCVNKNNIRYEKELEIRRGHYPEWIRRFEEEHEPGDLGAAAEWILICNPKGRPASRAGEWIGEWAARFPEALLLYGDEDVWPEGGVRSSPLFQPDWSPDVFEERFYTGSLMAVRRSLVERYAGRLEPLLAEVRSLRGRAKEGGEGLPAYRDACQRFVRGAAELAGGFERGKGRETIRHVPRILFHNEDESGREEWMRYGPGCPPEVEGPCANGVTLSVVIPSRDNPDMLEICLRGICGGETDLRYEIIVVDNGSAPEEKARIEDLLERVRDGGAPGPCKVVYCCEPMEFDFSAMCNLGVSLASGELLLFLNDDVELVERGTLKAMAEPALRPHTGAVGLKLLYPDAKALGQIQHAGITNTPGGPVHKLQFHRDDKEYYFGRNRGRRNVLAVTGACLMVERKKFEEAGGFSRELPVAYNDVDLCLRLYELGYENVCLCDRFALHDESYSRGRDDSPDKRERLVGELGKLYERHPGLKGWDPYYSDQLDPSAADMAIRPLYETSGNRPQPVGVSALRPLSESKIKACRRDACLMVRLETVSSKEGESLSLAGWSVVLGDNNACYDKMLVLRKCVGSGAPGEGGENRADDVDGAPGEGCRDCGSAPAWGFPLQGRYRPDLAENMPDQIHVELGGYLVELAAGALSAGRYRMGVMARNRVTGTKLINWANQTVQVGDGAAGV